MANVKWIKLNVDMFDNRKIKHIRKLPAGNEVVLIWVMLLTLAGRCNAGGMIFLTENIPYNAKMLADELDFEEATVKLALDALETLGMICTNDAGFMQIPGWEAHQNVESMDRIRESKRLAQARWRAKKAAAIESRENVESTVDTSTVESTRISVDDAEEEEEEEEERRNNIYTPVVTYLNEKAGTKYRASSAKTQKVIHARVAEGFTLEDFMAVIDKKTAEWMGTEWEKFLRPETLFGPKFEIYLNQNTTKKGGQNDGVEGAGAADAYQVGTWV